MHLDIKCAFQNGKLTDLVYVRQPELGDGSGKVWRLRKALYGLNRQHGNGTNFLLSCCVILTLLDVTVILLCTFESMVDASYSYGLMICSYSHEVMKPLCDQILARFKGRSEGEIGEIGKVLGIEIMRDRPSLTMTISRRMKIKQLLDSNGMKGCRTSPTPLVPKEKLKSLKEDPSQEPATISEHQTYMKVVGSIQYIACVTWPDLAFAAHSLARHMSASSKEHWLAAQHVMRYLQKTVNLGL